MNTKSRIWGIAIATSTFVAMANIAHAAGIDDVTTYTAIAIWILGCVCCGAFVGWWFGIRGLAIVSSAIFALIFLVPFMQYEIAKVLEEFWIVAFVATMVLVPFVLSGTLVCWSKMKKPKDVPHEIVE